MSDFCPQCGDLVEMASHSCRYPPLKEASIVLRNWEVLREGAWASVRLVEVKKGEKFRCVDEDAMGTVLTARSDGQWCDWDDKVTIQAQIDQSNSVITVEESECVL